MINTDTTSRMLNLGGTLRACTPQETLQKIEPLCKKFGITRLANITGLDHIGIPVVTAIRPNAKNLSTSQGKGLTLELAKISAIMESIELWHAEHCLPAELIASFHELKQEYPCINPTLLCKNFYELSHFYDRPLKWFSATNLINDEKIFIPQAALSLDTTSPSLINLLFSPSTNGLASGNTLSEATCHAIFEIIERDATASWKNKTPAEQEKTLINNSSITSEHARALIRKIEDQQINIHLWELTSELNIPVYQCAISDEDLTRSTNLFSGKGAHFSKEIALLRAITEAVQVRLTFIAGSRDDIFPAAYEQLIFLPKNSTPGKKNYEQTPQKELANNFDDLLKQLLNHLHQYKINSVIRYDHTRDDINIPVVQVIIPNLRAPT